MTRTLKLLLCGYALAIPAAVHFAVPAEYVPEVLLDLGLTHAAAIGTTLLLCRSWSANNKRVCLWALPAGALSAGASVYLGWLFREFGLQIFTGRFWSQSLPDMKGGPVAIVAPFVIFTILSLAPTLVAMACYYGRKSRHETQIA
jgi:cytochrome bd-type quinol oxidase subunit 1